MACSSSQLDELCSSHAEEENSDDERLISMEEVKQHCFEDSAWLVIGDGV